MGTSERIENTQRRAARDKAIENSIVSFLESEKETDEAYADGEHTPAWYVALYKQVSYRMGLFDRIDVHVRKGKIILTRRNK